MELTQEYKDYFASVLWEIWEREQREKEDKDGQND